VVLAGLVESLKRLAKFQGGGWLTKHAVRPVLDVWKKLVDLQGKEGAEERWKEAAGMEEVSELVTGARHAEVAPEKIK